MVTGQNTCWNGDHTQPNYISRLRYHQMFIPKWAEEVKKTAPQELTFRAGDIDTIAAPTSQIDGTLTSQLMKTVYLSCAPLHNYIAVWKIRSYLFQFQSSFFPATHPFKPLKPIQQKSRSKEHGNFTGTLIEKGDTASY